MAHAEAGSYTDDVTSFRPASQCSLVASMEASVRGESGKEPGKVIPAGLQRNITSVRHGGTFRGYPREPNAAGQGEAAGSAFGGILFSPIVEGYWRIFAKPPQPEK